MKRPSRPIHSTFLALGVGLNLLVAMATAFAAYGGTFNPDERLIGALAAMALPIMLISGVILIAVDFLIDRRLGLVIIAGWLAGLPPILSFCPLNVIPASLDAGERERSFTFLTYNVMNFFDYTSADSRSAGAEPPNRTLDYLIASDADIISLQEAHIYRSADGTYVLHPDIIPADGPFRDDTRRKLNELTAKYPYIVPCIQFGYGLTLLSKFPVRIIETELPKESYNYMGFAQIDIKGRPVTLAAVHLQSVGFSEDDKEIYKEAIRDVPESKGELKSELKSVRSKLLTKLSWAFSRRVMEAGWLKSVVDSIGGITIVAGDFNDIPDCYAARLIKGDEFRDAYSDAAFGPAVTFRADMFYFRIDQVLYRGPMKAVRIQSDRSGRSDHKPLLTTFMFDAPAKE